MGPERMSNETRGFAYVPCMDNLSANGNDVSC